MNPALVILALSLAGWVVITLVVSHALVRCAAG